MDRPDVAPKLRPLFLTTLFLPCLMVFMRLDNDLWFLLNAGRYVVNEGIPHIEPFTMHSGFHFMMQQWLSSVLLWSAYDRFGALGLNLLILLSGFSTLFIIYRLSMLVSDGRFIVSYGVSMMAGFMMVYFITQRPATFSIILFALELLALEWHSKKGDIRPLAALPILSILLVNMHAAMWPMIFVLAIPYVFEGAFHEVPYLNERLAFMLPRTEMRWRSITISLFAAALAGFVNPYGIEAMTYLSRSLGHPEISRLVGEMQPVDITGFTGKFVFAWMFIIIAIYWTKQPNPVAMRHILLSLGTSYLALSSIRGFLLFALCASFPIASYLRDIGRKQTNTHSLSTFGKGLVGSVLIGIVVLSVIVTTRYDPNEQVDKSLMKAISFLKDENKISEITLYNSYDEGALLQYYGLKPYIDTRAEVFVIENNRRADVMEEFYDLQRGALYYKDLTEKYQFTHLLVVDYDMMRIPLEHDADYDIVFSEGPFAVFKKKK